MSELTIVRDRTPVDSLLADPEGKLSPEERERLLQLLRDSNPHAGIDGFVPAMTPIILPADAATPYVPQPVRREVAQLAFTPRAQREVLNEGLDVLGGEELDAIAQFLEDYGLYGATGDTNTFGAAALGHTAGRAGKMYAAIREVDRRLAAWNVASPAERPEAERLFRKAHIRLNEHFKLELARYRIHSQRQGAANRNPFQNPQRAMNMTRSGSRQLPLTSYPTLRPVRKFMEYGRVLGRGMIVVDFGMRANNVRVARANGRDPYRVLTREAIGFGVSIGAGVTAALVLGPVGWILAIFVIGTAAVAGDLFGKWAGGMLYDQF